MIKGIILYVCMATMGLFQVQAQTENAIIIDKDIQLVRLQDSVFMHVTWHESNDFGRFSSNGMVIIKNGQAAMIDTPMDNEKTERLIRYMKDSMRVEVTKLVIGHFHDDCLGGLKYIQSKHIESVANAITIQKCKDLGLPIPSISFSDSYVIDLNGEILECRFLGGGHSPDNITVWIPGKKILFGGCLVKSYRSTGLGNLSDAVVSDWDNTIRNILKLYSDIKIVIPGHGDFGGAELLNHTIELVEKQKIK